MAYTPALYFIKFIPCNHLREGDCPFYNTSCAMVHTYLFPMVCPLYELPQEMLI